MKTKALITAISAAFALCSAPHVAAQSNQELAKKLNNPVADLISVPFQLNYDEGYGPDGDGTRTNINIQPVIPFTLNSEWNVISRTIVPLIYQDDVVPNDDEFGLGNVVQSFFFSPKEPSATGWIWGVGPVIQIPLSSDDQFGADDWAVGPTAVALKQTGSWTFGALANHLWDVDGDTDINASFLQPFLAYSTENAVTYTINSESTYDWEEEQWTIPINALVSKVIPIGGRPVSISGGIRYWAETADNGPDDFGLRLNVTYLFPR